MKKIISLFLCFVLVLSAAALSACAKREQDGKQEKLSIVCTIFPEYDWVLKVLGDSKEDAEVTLLLDNGIDLHNYQPTADDMIKIANCDMFIYVGGESDEWVDDALDGAVNQNMTVINLLDTLGSKVKEEELVEGMEPEDDEEEEEEETEYDEHVWLSLQNAKLFVNTIAAALGDLRPEMRDAYFSNAGAYGSSLDALDKEYQAAVDSAKIKTLLFGDRFPFRYLADDYGLTYYAAFAGCSAETEASFETISFLAKKVDALGLSYVVTIEGTNHKIAQTIIDNTQKKNQKIVTLDSMQATTTKDVENGATYLGIMQKNLDVLKTALSVN